MAGKHGPEFATGAALRDAIARDRLRASRSGDSQAILMEIADSASKVVAQIAPTAVMPMNRKWKVSTIANANAVSEAMDPVRNARIIENLADGMAHHKAAAFHGVSIRAVRAVFGSHLLGLDAVKCDYKTLWAARNATTDMNAAKNEAGREAELAALGADARLRRAEAPVGSPEKKRSNREVRHAARRAAFAAWIKENGDHPPTKA